MESTDDLAAKIKESFDNFRRSFRISEGDDQYELSSDELSEDAMSNTHNSIPFNRLKGRENFSEWKVGAKAHLIIKGLWKCCLTVLSATATEKEQENDLKAIGEITLLLEPSNYTHIENAKSAKEAWDGITAAFDDTGTGRKVALLQQLVSLKQDQCGSMEDYVNKMSTLWSKVKAAGFNIDEEVAGSLMLVGLPSQYKPMILAVENSGTNITVDYVKKCYYKGWCSTLRMMIVMK